MRPGKLLAPLLVVILLSGTAWAATETIASVERTRVQFWIPAVGQHENGTLFGVASSLEVLMQRPGTGQVFVATQPLTEIDMQGSARLAVDTAASITGRPASAVDFFVTVRTSAVTIGGPSAGAALAVAVSALLMGWSVRDDVVMTGMINPDGSIGPIGGILQKVDAAASVGAKRFLIPLGQSIVIVPRTETVQNGPFVQQRTVQEQVDARAYARDRYGIDLNEAADLYDAIVPFTGFELVRPQPQSNPLEGEAYQNITTTLASNLTESAQARADDLDARYAAVRSRISTSERAAVEGQLQTARARIASAGQAVNDTKHYLAASLAFQAHVACGYAEALIAFFEAGSGTVGSYAAAYLQTSDGIIQDVSSVARRVYPIPAAQLDAHAAAEQRVQAAIAAQAQARAASQGGNHASALQTSSFARERAESARWWAQIGDTVAAAAPTPRVNATQLATLIQRYDETVDLQLQYAALIVPQANLLDGARSALQESHQALASGRAAAALFSLLDAMSRTSTALVALSGTEPVRQRLPDLADAAAFQIELAADQGAPPVYAISLFELAESQVATDPQGAYASYSLARISARTSLQAAGVVEPAPDVRRAGGNGSGGTSLDVLSRGLLVGFLFLAVAVLVWAATTLRGAPPANAQSPALIPQRPPPPLPPPATPPSDEAPTPTPAKRRRARKPASPSKRRSPPGRARKPPPRKGA